jgi:peptidoglycan/xylan/chitin deacetylase (PgdA/CDA1 family)
MSRGLLSAAKRHLKRSVIQGTLEAIALSHADRFLTSAAGRGAIFTLHHVRPERGFEFEPNRHLSVTPEFLDQAIGVALGCGLQPVGLEELPALLSDSSDQRKFVCFTLDDGYRDNAEYAAPVFRKHRVPYTIFITPGFVERTRTMWWETIEALVRKTNFVLFDFGSGPEQVQCTSLAEKWTAFERLAEFVQVGDEDEAVARIDLAAQRCRVDPMQIVEDEIMTADELRRLLLDPLAQLGAHTLTHPNLARVSSERLYREISGSAARIADYCDRIPKALSYPYGGRNAVGVRETNAASERGFTVGVTTQPGILNSVKLKTFAQLPRISLNGNYQRKRYVRALASGLPFKFI